MKKIPLLATFAAAAIALTGCSADGTTALTPNASGEDSTSEYNTAELISYLRGEPVGDIAPLGTEDLGYWETKTDEQIYTYGIAACNLLDEATKDSENPINAVAVAINEMLRKTASETLTQEEREEILGTVIMVEPASVVLCSKHQPTVASVIEMFNQAPAPEESTESTETTEPAPDTEG